MKVDLEALRAKFKALAPIMDERVSRLWAAAEVESLGRGGTAALQRAQRGSVVVASGRERKNSRSFGGNRLQGLQRRECVGQEEGEGA
jgi:hypothetical protein